jgi:hypothetical protein
LAEETRGRLRVPPRRDQTVQDVALLIHRAPQVMLLAVDFKQDFIEGPFGAQLRVPPLERVRVR